MSREFRPVTPTVEAISRMNFEGNITPHSWYKHIRLESGKPDLVGIIILADLVYWHRATEHRDEKNGAVIGHERKFHADKLQKVNSGYEDTFGFTKRQVKDALARLEKAGLIIRELRNFKTESGLFLSNVQYIDLNADRIAEITYATIRATHNKTRSAVHNKTPQNSQNNQETFERRGYVHSASGVSTSSVGGDTSDVWTYTENTSETSNIEGGTPTQSSRKTSDEKDLADGTRNALKSIPASIPESVADRYAQALESNPEAIESHHKPAPAPESVPDREGDAEVSEGNLAVRHVPRIKQTASQAMPQSLSGASTETSTSAPMGIGNIESSYFDSKMAECLEWEATYGFGHARNLAKKYFRDFLQPANTQAVKESVKESPMPADEVPAAVERLLKKLQSYLPAPLMPSAERTARRLFTDRFNAGATEAGMNSVIEYRASKGKGLDARWICEDYSRDLYLMQNPKQSNIPVLDSTRL
jgi:hypothetical protein